MMLALQLLSIFILIVSSAFFSSSEVAFFSLPTSKVRGFRNQVDPQRRRVWQILSRSKSLLVTIFMYNTIVNVLLQNSTSDLFEETSGGWLLKVGIPLILVLILGELIPKYLGLIHNEKLALYYAPSIEWLEWIITPLRVLITRVSYTLSRLFFFFLKAEPALSKEELAHILKSSEGKGILHQEEAELIYGVLKLNDKQINELMRPRNEMPTYNIEEPISKLIHLFSEERLTEVALVEMPQEKMLGVIKARDFFIKRSEITKGHDLLKILRKPFYTPETTTASTLLQQLRGLSTNSAWVVDEYGTTCGMVTEHDLLSGVVGKTSKSKDEKPDYERISKNTIVANGTMTLDEVRDLFEVQLPSEHHMLTIGGFITEKIGDIPAAGTTLEQETLYMRVLSSDKTKIRKVYIQKRATT